MVSGCNKYHDEFVYEENHHIQSLCYETNVERLAATQIEICPGLSRPFSEVDLGKVARQKNGDPGDGVETYWVLSGISPTEWCELTNKTIPEDLDVKVGVSSDDTTASFLLDKLGVATGSNVSGVLEIIEQNPGGNEKAVITFDDSKLGYCFFKFINPELGVSIASDQANDTLNVGSNDSSVFVSGNLATKALNFSVNKSFTDQNLFSQVNPISGSSVVAGNPATQLSLISTDSTVSVSGNNSTKQINLSARDEKVKVSDNDASPGNLLDKIQAGTNVSVVENNDGGVETLTISASGELDTEVAVVQARRATNYVTTLSFVDLTFDTIDVENKDTVLELSDTDTDRVLIKEDGVYRFDYCLSLDIASQARFDFRVRLNDSVVIPGSESYREDGGDTFLNSCYGYFSASAGDFVSFQAKRDGGSGVIEAGAVFSVQKLEGAKGDHGATGPGSTVIIQEGGTPVVNTPHSAINFDDSDFDVQDNGDGSVTVSSTGGSLPVFGTHYFYAEELSLNSTTSSTYQPKLSLPVVGIPAGEYRIGYSYRWRHSSTGSDFRAHLVEDSTQEIMLHQQEPKDTGGNQAYRCSGFVNRTLTAGNHLYELEYSEQSGGTASISEVRVEFWRVR